MVGWRGEPGKKDEPQHVKQGKVMLPMLEAMDLNYFIIKGDKNEDYETTKKALDYTSRNLLRQFWLFARMRFQNIVTTKYKIIIFDLQQNQEKLL